VGKWGWGVSCLGAAAVAGAGRDDKRGGSPINTGVACAILPTSSSDCMMRLTREASACCFLGGMVEVVVSERSAREKEEAVFRRGTTPARALFRVCGLRVSPCACVGEGLRDALARKVASKDETIEKRKCLRRCSDTFCAPLYCGTRGSRGGVGAHENPPKTRGLDREPTARSQTQSRIKAIPSASTTALRLQPQQRSNPKTRTVFEHKKAVLR
jgi:hypothetical protein